MIVRRWKHQIHSITFIVLLQQIINISSVSKLIKSCRQLVCDIFVKFLSCVVCELRSPTSSCTNQSFDVTYRHMKVEHVVFLSLVLDLFGESICSTLTYAAVLRPWSSIHNPFALVSSHNRVVYCGKHPRSYHVSSLLSDFRRGNHPTQMAFFLEHCGLFRQCEARSTSQTKTLRDGT